MKDNGKLHTARDPLPDPFADLNSKDGRPNRKVIWPGINLRCLNSA